VKRKKNSPAVDPLPQIRECIRTQCYRVRPHAKKRQGERGITLKDVLYALKNGVHKKSYDSFCVREQIWRYAIEGKTIDGAEIRVIVSLIDGLAIITVIRLTKGRKR